jgi:hypothetical protein
MDTHIKIKSAGVFLLALSSSAFVQLYNWAAGIRFKWEHKMNPHMNGLVFLIQWSWLGYVFAGIVGIGAGYCILGNGRRKEAVLEGILWFTVLLFVIWIGLDLCSWEMANVPILSNGPFY